MNLIHWSGFFKKQKEAKELLESLNYAQLQYINRLPKHIVFAELLERVCQLCESKYAFVGELVSTDEEQRVLKPVAVSNKFSDKKNWPPFETRPETDTALCDRNTLYGSVITSAIPVISNDPKNDSRNCPAGLERPDWKNFLGLPCFYGSTLMGLVCLADHNRDYSDELVAFLRPLLVTCGNLLHAYDSDLREEKATEELHASRLSLEYQVMEHTHQSRMSNEKLRLENSDRMMVEKQLRASLEEKEILLKEVYHRTKNNLQIISSLIKLKMRQVGDPKFSELLKEVLNQIQVIGRIHNKVVQENDLSNIDCQDYFRDLVNEIVCSYGYPPEEFSLSLWTEGRSLDMGKSLYLGLIVNELVTNSIKHAFQSSKMNELSIQLIQDIELGKTFLTFRDNGPGLPSNFDWKQKTSGLNLVVTLVEKQMEGEIELGPGPGTEFIISYPDQIPKTTPTT